MSWIGSTKGERTNKYKTETEPRQGNETKEAKVEIPKETLDLWDVHYIPIPPLYPISLKLSPNNFLRLPPPRHDCFS